MPPDETACPHAEIRFCPLYIASHENDGLGCVDGMVDPCRVARGDGAYAAMVARLRPRLVAERRFLEEAEAMKAQRRRNLRAAGLASA